MVRDLEKYRFDKLYGSKIEERQYLNWLKNDFNKFKNDNKKTVMYLVKEFEMKKSATAYKRATTSKTGIIDPLNYLLTNTMMIYLKS